MKWREENFAQWVISHRWWVILASILLITAMASGGRFLQFTTDYRVFFSADNPQLQAFQSLENTYTRDDNVLFVIAPKDGKVFTRKTLASIEQLTRLGWQTPYSIRVDSISNFQYSYASGDELIVEDMVQDVTLLSRTDIKRIRDIVLKEPLLVNRLISPQAHVAGVNITIQFPGIDPAQESPEVMSYARELADQVRADNSDIEIYITGMVPLDNAFAEATLLDMQSLLPISFGLILLGLFFLLRSSIFASVIFLIIILSIASAMGLAGWMGISLTSASGAAPIMILTLAVANSVHILVTFSHNLVKGDKKEAAIKESLRINLQPVFLASFTTAFGFLSMNFSDSPPFHDLGNIVAVGVMISFLLSVTFLPALISMLPVRIKNNQSDVSPAMSAIADFVVSHRTGLLWGAGIVVIISASLIPKNKLDDTFSDYFDQRVPFRIASDFANENLGGLYRISYSLDSGAPGAVNDPEFLRKVEAFAQWYRQQPAVIHVESYTDILKRLNKNMHGDNPDWYRLPDNRELAAQYLLLYEMSLPYGLSLNNQISVDKSATKLTVTLEKISSEGMLALEERAQAWLDVNAPASMRGEGSGSSIMFAHLTQRNIYSMLGGASLALVLISLALIIALRSISIGLISLIPNLVPALIGFGLWALFNGKVGIGLAVVISMTMGVVVDDTVHFLSKYLHARREKNMNSIDSVRYAFMTVGKALWITSLVLVAGFFVLSLSSFKINSDMGLLSAIIIIIALIVDFLFFPPLLMKLEKDKLNKRKITTQE
ncbi:MAG TPA: hypothetical protein ENK04_05255 [Gammaproteobacteria bacterium]|nr:hypothetical protein [Gammaproteobacteria bacterium]